MSEQPDWTTLAWWTPRVEQIFRLTTADEAGSPAASVEVRLAEASGTPGQVRPFRLLFVGAPGLFLPQSIYRLFAADSASEAMDIFLVPLQPDQAGTKFEAIFN
ncbi:hypothetical protein MF271_02210 (plasmid) [Deinococcus sp. KNUC1210]|uniref:DUF6916 family protein n=1 Tax=Deinococcus sp. KNUC1210 TaxID=2917691 RepID=UPI001EF13A12|nr:hypothetical protein [Deinococcus sp. KNUC1210]ULH14115.1 hypothetical protein MF271_02210 [Deinococcus sp. KNUC1210]